MTEPRTYFWGAQQTVKNLATKEIWSTHKSSNNRGNSLLKLCNSTEINVEITKQIKIVFQIKRSPLKKFLESTVQVYIRTMNSS